MFKEKIIMRRFAERLDQLMDEHGETCTSVADYLDLHRSTISRYINNQAPAKRATIKELARYFGVNPAWLMGYDVKREFDYSKDGTNLSPKEKKILKEYRNLPDNEKEKLEGIIKVFNASEKRDTG